MPVPSSSTVTTPSCRATVTVPEGGLHLAALSSRLVSARSRAAASPSTYHGSAVTTNDSDGARRRTRATAWSSTSCSSTVPITAGVGSSRASSTRSPTRVVSSSSWARTSVSSSARASSGSEAPAWVSRSMLVRSEVSGVRSSWPASATSRRCRSRDAASEASIWLNADASRATSSSPSTWIGASRSVRAMSSAAAVSRRTGRSPLRATPQPATPAVMMPAMPNSRVTSPSLVEHVLLRLQRLGDDQRVAGALSMGTATTR